MKKIIGFLVLMVMTTMSSIVYAGVQDSIGVEKKEGKRYVLHRIEAKETLYALARRYGASVEEIKKANTDANINDLKVGQVIRIPKEEKNVPKQAVSSASKQTHIVIPGETLYSIAKKYNVSVDELKKVNPNAGTSGLGIGDELVIPGALASTDTKKNNPVQERNAVDPLKPTAHKVVARETLYSISKRYGVSVEELKKYNPELANGLKVGQTLRLSATIELPKEDQIIATEDKIKEAVKQKELNSLKDTMEVKPPVVLDTALTSEQEKEKKYLDSMSNIKVVPNGEFKKITETGFAEVIEGGDSDKYLALHKSAPVGTIIQVINEANNQRIFVRVIGKLPVSGLNDKVVLKISKKAFARLSGVDKKIPVTLSYIM
jgi:LysM repeat protein